MAALFRLFCVLGALTVATVAQAQGIDRDAAIDTEHLFGFTEGADIGGKGEGELENTTIGRLGRPGSFAAFTNEMAFRYGLAEHFRASFGALPDYHGIRRVPDLTDRTALNFSGLSSEFRWQLLERVASQVDLTLSFSPEWRRIDDTSGEAVESYALPILLLADTTLIPNAMFAAVNLTYAPAFTHTNGSWQQEHPLEISPAIAVAITDGVFLGAEIRHITRNQDGFYGTRPFCRAERFYQDFGQP
jgi:hypothetical protein